MFRISFLCVYDSNISFLLQFLFSQSLCISSLLGCEEIRKKRNVRDIRAVADKAGVRIFQFQKSPGEDEQESKPRTVHEL